MTIARISRSATHASPITHHPSLRRRRNLQVDPGYDYDQTDPMSFNLYAYVRGNPIMGTDPTGMANDDMRGLEAHLKTSIGKKAKQREANARKARAQYEANKGGAPRESRPSGAKMGTRNSRDNDSNQSATKDTRMPQSGETPNQRIDPDNQRPEGLVLQFSASLVAGNGMVAVLNVYGNGNRAIMVLSVNGAKGVEASVNAGIGAFNSDRVLMSYDEIRRMNENLSAGLVLSMSASKDKRASVYSVIFGGGYGGGLSYSRDESYVILASECEWSQGNLSVKTLVPTPW